MKQHMKYLLMLILALSLSIIIYIPCVAATVVYKDGDTATITVRNIDAFHGGKAQGETCSTDNGGSRANNYNNRIYWYGGYSIDILSIDSSTYTPQFINNSYFYCIHDWKTYNATTTTVSRRYYTDLTHSTYWRTLSDTQRVLLSRVTMYGFPAKDPYALGVSCVDDAYAATQAIIWEITSGRRDFNGYVSGYTSSSEERSAGVPAAINNVYFYRDKYMRYAYTGNGYNAGDATPALTAYYNILSAMSNHDTLASFNNGTLTLSWDSSNKCYSGSITDTNGILSNSTLVSSLPTDVSYETNGNTITFHSKHELTGTTVQFNKNLPSLYQLAPLAVLQATNGVGQEFCSGCVDDPRKYYLTLNTVYTPSYSGFFYKVDGETQAKLSGAQFKAQEYDATTGLYSDISNPVTYDAATMKYSISGLTNTLLNLGKYRLIETVCPNGYSVNNDFDIYTYSTTPGEVADFGSCVNKRNPSYYTFMKKDSKSGKALRGAKFKIQDYNSYILFSRWEDVPTNEYSILSSQPYLIRGLESIGTFIKSTRFRIVEVTPPTGYSLSSTMLEFNTTDYAPGMVDSLGTIYDDPLPMYFTFSKADADTGAILSGATFHLNEWSSSQGKYVTSSATITYNADTKTYTTSALYNTYDNSGYFYIVEDVAPNGYQIGSPTLLDISKRTPGSTYTLPNITDKKKDVDVGIEFVPINNIVYQGSKVFVSALITNKSDIDFTPTNPLTVNLTASYGTTVTTLSQINIVPQHNQQLVWFEFNVPYASDIQLTYKVSLPPGLTDTDMSNNSAVISLQAVPYTVQTTPQPKFELKPPSTFVKDMPSPYSEGITGYVWEYWEWSNGFVKRHYETSCSMSVMLKPAATAGYSAFDSLNNIFTTRSGYGLDTKFLINIGLLPSTMYTGIPKSDVYLPEFNYSQDDNQYKTLNIIANVVGSDNVYTCTFPVSSGTGYCYHYTPMWYPDGIYTIAYRFYDMWTPLGAIEVTATKDIMIHGSLYDDFYTTQKGITSLH